MTWPAWPDLPHHHMMYSTSYGVQPLYLLYSSRVSYSWLLHKTFRAFCFCKKKTTCWQGEKVNLFDSRPLCMVMVFICCIGCCTNEPCLIILQQILSSQPFPCPTTQAKRGHENHDEASQNDFPAVRTLCHSWRTRGCWQRENAPQKSKRGGGKDGEKGHWRIMRQWWAVHH